MQSGTKSAWKLKMYNFLYITENQNLIHIIYIPSIQSNWNQQLWFDWIIRNNVQESITCRCANHNKSEILAANSNLCNFTTQISASRISIYNPLLQLQRRPVSEATDRDPNMYLLRKPELWNFRSLHPGFVAHTPQPKPLASDPFMILNFLQDDMNILQLKKIEDLWVYGIQTTN